MKVAALLYRMAEAGPEASLSWVDPFSGAVLGAIPVPLSPNFGVFPEHDLILISYAEFPDHGPSRDWTDVFWLSDGSHQARLPMDCRAHFNVSPLWSTFLPSPDGSTIYVYKSRTLGHHQAEDYVCGLDLATLSFSAWNFRVPECVVGWSTAGGRAHAQMLFVSDGVEVGQLPGVDLEQKVGFWLGPEEGMGPLVPIGPRPRAHNALGHARAILSAPEGPLSVVVCTDGVVHLIDPVSFRYLDRQQAEFSEGHGMPIFAAQIDRQGRFLYIGTATDELRPQGLIERVVVHDLHRRRRSDEWAQEVPWSHFALSEDGRHLCGARHGPDSLCVLETGSGRVSAIIPLEGAPQYLALVP